MDYLSFLVWLILPLFALQYLILSRRKNLPLPAGSFPLPIVGNIFEFQAGKPHKCLAKLAERYGPLMSLRVGHHTIVVASSALVAKEVLGKNDAFVSNRPMGDALRAHRHNEFSLVYLPIGDQWRSLPKICNAQIFSINRVEASKDLRRRKVEELVCYAKKCSKDRVAIDIGQAAFTTALNFLSNAFFSVDLVDYNSDTCRRLKQLMWAISVETSKPNVADFFPMLGIVDPWGIRRHMETLFSELMDIIGNVIEKRLLESPKKNEFGSHSDLLDALRHESSEELELPDILHIFIDLIVAGTESTSGMVEWTLAELLRNPDKLTRAKDELHQVIGKDKFFTEINISRLPYLKAVIKEVFRLHPVVPLLPRQVDTEIEIYGFRVPKNSRIWINVYAMGRDPRVWEDPDSFEPERFLKRNVEVKGGDFELIPFGGGRRICPALPLAMRMVPLIIGSLVHSFDWELEHGADPRSLDMDERLGVAMLIAQPLRVIPKNDV